MFMFKFSVVRLFVWIVANQIMKDFMRLPNGILVRKRQGPVEPFDLRCPFSPRYCSCFDIGICFREKLIKHQKFDSGDGYIYIPPRVNCPGVMCAAREECLMHNEDVDVGHI